MVSLSWILRSHILQHLPVTALSLKRQVCPASELTLTKSSSDQESYSHQKERSGSCPPLQFYLLKVYPTPVVMLQPHRLPSCSLNLHTSLIPKISHLLSLNQENRSLQFLWPILILQLKAQRKPSSGSSKCLHTLFSSLLELTSIYNCLNLVIVYHLQ